MNENSFKNLEDIDNFRISFKCFDGSDGYNAVFHIYDKCDPEIHYQVTFEISGTEYNSDTSSIGQTNGEYISSKFGNIENCFQTVGIKYIKGKVKNNNLKNKNSIDLLTLIM